MQDEQIFQKIVVVIHEVFENDSLVISRETSAEEVEEWDSMQHIGLILTVEELFEIRFSTSEVVNLQVVGDLVEQIATKLKG